jgi:acetate kinase
VRLERFGYHGLSYEYIVSQLPVDAGRTVIAHLGSGSSLCAVRSGIPVDVTMGVSPLGGLMMATRPGDIDPGIALRLLSGGFDAKRLTDLFYYRSGLCGVSGGCPDMQTLLERAPTDLDAGAAVDLYVYQLVKQLGSMIAILDGIDTLVFTGGIGENAPAIRSRVCERFRHTGLQIDESANVGGHGRVISRSASAVRVMVVPADESASIAKHVVRVLETGR